MSNDNKIKNKLSSAKEIQELENELGYYRRVTARDENFRKEVEKERNREHRKGLKVAL